MRNFIASALILSIGISSIISCKNTSKTAASTPSEGLPGEVLVVGDEDNLDEIKDAFSSFSIEDPILVLAEHAEEKKHEKAFNFWFARSESWETNEKTASMVVVVGDAKKFAAALKDHKPLKKTKTANDIALKLYSNVWSTPQTVVHIDCKPEELKAQMQGDLAKELYRLLYTQELAQGFPGTLASNAYTDSVSKLIWNNYGFTFQFPPQFRLEYTNNEVVWLRQETQKFYRHLFINIFRDSISMDSMNAAIANRNFFTSKYVKNTEGMRALISESALFPLQYTNENMHGQNVKVLRGWYHEEGTFNRGPFARYYFHDTKNHRYIAVDGFLFAPNMPRQSFYRIFDLIANSVKWNP
ncbi:MAG: DUF4837 family protein [Bacteroidia bacterium]|nr:DUF4837 family protein [Bacteroidia bacterium]